MKQKTKSISFALFSILLMASFVSPTNAATSEWVDLYGGKARLSAVKDPATDVISGMIELKLKKDWKTYWRKPGGAGIPPIFDFTGSTFFTLDEIQFPVPEIGYDADQFIGYHNSVNFVFTGKATSFDASINLSMLAGVCEKICIPAMADFKIDAQALNQSDPKTLMSLMLNKSLLPKEATAQFSLSNIIYENSFYSATPTLPAGLEKPVLLVEGPNGWFSGIVKINVADKRFSFTLPQELTGDNKLNTQFKYTLIASGQAVEGTLPLTNNSN